jgi:hypothetical protein
MSMGFDKRKELYWVAAILLSTFITGSHHDTLVHEYDLKNHRGTYLDNKQFLRSDLTFQHTGPGRWLYRQK